MSLIFEKLEIRNFLSFGNVPQVINLNKKPYQLVIGYNKDKGDSPDDKNGCGKSSIINALHFTLFGKSIDNRINLPSIVNAINGKNCEVKLYFSKDNKHYIIHRGRAPVFLKFYVDGEEVTDKSQGNNKDTQKEINQVLGFSEEVYNQIFSLSPIVNSFLEQPLQKQRVIIESILGVNQLTQKAEVLKEIIKQHKQDVKNEQFIIDKLKATNISTLDNYNKQKIQIQEAYNKWENNNKNDINEIKSQLNILNSIDIEQEKANYKLLQEYNRITSDNNKKKTELMKLCQQIQEKNNDIQKWTKSLVELNNVNIDIEESIYNYNMDIKNKEQEYKLSLQEHNLNKNKLQQLTKDFQNNCKKIEKIEKELSNITKNICPFCGQEMNKEESDKHIELKTNEINQIKELNHKLDLQIIELNSEVQNFKTQTFEYKEGFYKDYESILQHKVNKEKLQENIDEGQQLLKQLMEQAQSNDYKPEPEIEKPLLHYKNEGEIIKHNLMIEQYTKRLEELLNEDNINPYELQLTNLNNPPLVDIDESKVIEIENKLKHEDILLKLLSNPDSYIRKSIVDTNLQFLNDKIRYYLAKMGSLHSVIFNNDMSVTISKMGIEYSYISTGEMARVSIALTLAFRDIWEQLNYGVNIFYIDEILDRSGLDTAGVEQMVHLLTEYAKKGDKNIFLVSHRDELVKSTDDIFTVVMENGFTNLEENGD